MEVNEQTDLIQGAKNNNQIKIGNVYENKYR
jgi:hypothetical protein